MGSLEEPGDNWSALPGVYMPPGARNITLKSGLEFGRSDGADARGLLALLVGAGGASAHQHWTDFTTLYPTPGETDSLYVRSGHNFPKTTLKVSEKVMQGVTVRTPDGQTLAVDVDAAKKQWLGALRPAGLGVYLVTFTLKRARAPKPSYEAKTILVAGAEDDAPEKYGLGSGLELIPGRVVSGLRPGDELPISLVLDGVPVGGELEVVPEDGKAVYPKTSPEQPAMFIVKTPGRYLVTGSIKGRGCSLVFQVREAGEVSK